MPKAGEKNLASQAYSSRLLRVFAWAFIIILIVSWFLVGIYTWNKVYAEESGDLRILAVALAQSTALDISGIQSSTDLLADDLGALSAKQHPDYKELLNKYLTAQPEIQSIYLEIPGGPLLAEEHAMDRDPGPILRDSAYENKHFYKLSRNFYIGSLIPDISKNEWYIPFKRRVFLANHLVLCVTVLMPLADGGLKAWSGYPLQTHTGLFLIRRDGYLVARNPPPNKTSFAIRQTGIAARYVASHVHSAGGVYLGYSKAVGQWRLGAVEDTPHYPLVAGASVLRSSLWGMWGRSMSGPSVVIVLLGLLGWVIYHYLRRSTELQEQLRYESETAIWEAKERAEVTLASIGDAVITTDIQSRVTGANAVAENMLRKKITQIQGQPLDKVFQIINETTRETVANPVRRVLDEGRVVGLANHTTLISADGSEYAIEDSAAPIRSRSGEILGVVLVFHDVSQRRQLAEQLAHQAGHDYLTQLPNRLLFQHELEKISQHDGREQRKFYVAILDLDGFKQVNDLFGHNSGDLLLKALAKRMKRLFGKDNIIARLGGDEFGLILFSPLDKPVIESMLAQALRKITDPVEVLGSLVTVSATIGLSTFPEDADTPGQLMRLADLAMYAAKAAGRNTFAFYDEVLEARQQAIAEGVRLVEQALKESTLVLWYQPLVALHGPVLGVEALLRLDRGDGRLLSPETFFSALDHPLLAGKIGRFVLDSAIHQGLLWLEQGIRLRIGINISARHLLDSSFMQDMHAVLERYPDFPRELIELEVTESAPMLDFPSAIMTLQAINALGIHIALDDFGTGNASLTYLQRLPAQTIKIDQSFVRDILVDDKDLAIVTGVTSTAQALGMEIVAEGVETLEHARKLERLGVNLLQGYAIAKPMPAAAIPDWVRCYKPVLLDN